jgi:hypothetical protein
MNKAEKYIKGHPEYEMHLVEKKFGNGRQLIKFFYNSQINSFKQGFLAYVDNQKWLKDRHEVMEEVQSYLLEDFGEIDDSEFFDNYYEDFGISITLTNVYDDETILKAYNEWRKEQFPKLCMDGGGVCYFDVVG